MVTWRAPLWRLRCSTNTPLQQQIDEFIAEGASWLPTNLLQDLLSPIGQLIHSGAAENALKEGAQAPDFALPGAHGTAVRLSHLLTQGPVIMTFYRGHWCPYCHLALRAYQQALPHMQAREPRSWRFPRRHQTTAARWPKSWS
jgi:AhpC/TSA family